MSDDRGRQRLRRAVLRPAGGAGALALAALLALGGCAAHDVAAMDCATYEECVVRASAAQEAGDPTLTRRYLEVACERDAAGCNQLGDHLGRAFPGDVGVELAYKRACNGGNAEGCARLGRLYATSDASRAANGARAYQSLSRACELDPDYCEEAEAQAGGAMASTACGQAVDCMAEAWGRWETGDLPGAAVSFEEACEMGDAGGCEEAGYLLVGWAVGADAERGMGLLQRACSMGRASACQALMTGAQNP